MGQTTHDAMGFNGNAVAREHRPYAGYFFFWGTCWKEPFRVQEGLVISHGGEYYLLNKLACM